MNFDSTALYFLGALIVAVFTLGVFWGKAKRILFTPDMLILLLNAYMKHNPDAILHNPDFKKKIRALFFGDSHSDTRRQLKLHRGAEQVADDIKHSIKQISNSLLRVGIFFETNGEYFARDGRSVRKLTMTAESVNRDHVKDSPYISDLMDSIPISRIAYKYESLEPHVPVLIRLVAHKGASKHVRSDLPCIENAVRQRLLSYMVKEILAVLVTDMDGTVIALVELHFDGIEDDKLASIKEVLATWSIDVERRLSNY